MSVYDVLHSVIVFWVIAIPCSTALSVEGLSRRTQVTAITLSAASVVIPATYFFFVSYGFRSGYEDSLIFLGLAIVISILVAAVNRTLSTGNAQLLKLTIFMLGFIALLSLGAPLISMLQWW